MLRCCLLLTAISWITAAPAQYNWKLEKEKNGITMYLSEMPGSKFKAVRVECTFSGTYGKLIAILANVPQLKDWIYHTKLSKLIKQTSVYDYVYYSETQMPFPLSNRDAIIHMRIKTDSLPKFLVITGTGEPDSFPEIPGKERVPHYKSSWKVTMPSSKTIHISYILEINPGGNIPSWISNSFVDKGPYETFMKLQELLKK